jgi:hypothetical protein
MIMGVLLLLPNARGWILFKNQLLGKHWHISSVAVEFSRDLGLQDIIIE